MFFFYTLKKGEKPPRRLQVSMWMIIMVKQIFCCAIGCVSVFFYILGGICTMVMSGFVLVWFFFPNISLSYVLVFMLSMEKKNMTTLEFLFFSNSVFFEKSLQIEIGSHSFDFFFQFFFQGFHLSKLVPALLIFFRWLIGFICFLWFHPHFFSLAFLSNLSQFLILSFKWNLWFIK